jgi:hypothetical protein
MLKQLRPPWIPNGLCPCQSGKLFRVCCLSAFGYVRKGVPRLTPLGNVTGFSQPGCYLAKTNNCSQGLTSEHYISKAVLQELGENIEIDGAPWQEPGARKKVGINNLTSKLLCARHNNALSPLDIEAAKFFRAIKQASIELVERSLSRRNTFHLFSGEMIELWMLKVTCGLCLSFASKDRVRVKEDHIFDGAKIARIFTEQVWDVGSGLYIRAAPGRKFMTHNAISGSPLTAEAEKRVVGMRLWILGIEFDLLFDMTGIVPAAGGAPRLNELRIKGERRAHVLYLTWPPGLPTTITEVLIKKYRG